MPDDESPVRDEMDAAHAAIGGVQAALESLVVRMEALADAQAETLQHVIRLQPVNAAEAEVAGVDAALDPDEHAAPAAEPNDTSEHVSPLRRLHQMVG